MAMDDGFCLKWGQHPLNLLRAFDRWLTAEQFTDVLVAAEGRVIKAHRIVLTAASEYFENIFELFGDKSQPIVVLKDTCYADVVAIIEFIYKGQVNVPQEQLGSLLKTAENLKIKGLADVNQENQPQVKEQDPLECSRSVQQGNSSNGSFGNSFSGGSHHSSKKGNGGGNRSSGNSGSGNSGSGNSSGSKKMSSSTSRAESLIAPSLLTDGSLLTSAPPPGFRITSTGELRRKPGRPRNSDRGIPYVSSRRSTNSSSNKNRMNYHPPLLMHPGMGSATSGGAAANFEPIAGPSGIGDNSNSMEHLEVLPTPGGPLTPDRIRSLGIVQLNEYMNSGTRQQFWEEPFVKVIMHAIRNKEIDIKRSSELLGCSYGTLYGRYRECFGYIKHSWNSVARYPSTPNSNMNNDNGRQQPPSSSMTTDHETMVFERLREGKINLAQAAVVLGVDPSLLAFQMDRMQSFNESPSLNDSSMRESNNFEIENNNDIEEDENDDDDDDNFVALGPDVVLEEGDDHEQEEKKHVEEDNTEEMQNDEDHGPVNGGSGEVMEDPDNYS